MRTTRLAVCLGAALFAGSALAHDYRVGSLFIVHPWTRATPPGAPTAGAYLTIRNDGDTADRLIGGASPLGTVELHSTALENGVMQMRQLDGVDIPPRETVTFKPGGFHLMIVGLKEPIIPDTRVPLTLRFDKAGEIAVELAAGAIGASPEHHGH